ncbi:class I SAM-dependent methyltransferase [Polycladidibacter hongkongensis]|uniref:class I SAM-dependent methyltransferase n=1 Tax=Polycladidibacter hongkongensis TaxID=1647556 RepID=UPI000836AE8E|nr:class I SAM-dependent methyltransferase [Pseudovibrio hongkongensis]
MSQQPLFDRALVADRRRRALSTNKQEARFLLDLATQEISDRLSMVSREFDRALDLGGHTGALSQALINSGKARQVIRADLFCADPNLPAPDLICDDALLPFASETLDLVASPLSLHLLDDLPGALSQIRRALRPDGLFLAAVLGADTLYELRDCLTRAEAEVTGGLSPRIIPMADTRDLGSLLQRAGFALPVVDTEKFTVRYDSAFALMKDLRAMGAANPLTARQRNFTRKEVFLRAAELYATDYSDPDGRIRATFTFVCLSGWAPHESQQQPLKPGTAKQSLADALKTFEKKT